MNYSTGALVGIVIGIILFLIAIGLLIGGIVNSSTAINQNWSLQKYANEVWVLYVLSGIFFMISLPVLVISLMYGIKHQKSYSSRNISMFQSSNPQKSCGNGGICSYENQRRETADMMFNTQSSKNIPMRNL